MAAYYTFEDYSGGKTDGPKSDNPYQDVIDACHNNPAAKLSSPEFPGVTIDEILAKLENPSTYPGYQDPRHCLVFWARPTQRVRALITEVQRRLLDVLPHLWIMQPANLHLTALEITHSRTAAEIDALVQQLLPTAPRITDFTLTHRARLVKPLLSFDAQALALSFLPADGEPRDHRRRRRRSSGNGSGHDHDDDAYTYHHLRRDLFAQASAVAGVVVESRYVIPSAHLTIGRFIMTGDLEGEDGKVDQGRVAGLLETIEGINRWLREEYWPREGEIRDGGEWVVGEEKGLEMRKGALWYGGGGETVRLGQGF